MEINTPPPSSLRPFTTQQYSQGQSMSNRFTFKIHLDPFAGATASPEHVAVLMNDFHSATASSPGWVHACIVFSTSVSSDSVRVTGIIPQKLISSESLANTMDNGFHIAPNAENDLCATPKHCKSIRKTRHSTQTFCIQEKPRHSFTDTRKWNNSSHASKLNTTTHDSTHPMSLWCNNAHKQHQFARVDMNHNPHGETGSIATNHASNACSTLERVDIVFILLVIGLTLFGYTCLYNRVSRDVIDPPRINRKQSDSIHLSRQHTRYTHHASTAQSMRKSNKDLYNPVKQSQETQNYTQIIGSIATALCGLFVSQSRTFKVFSFIAFNLLISGRAQYINCTGDDHDTGVAPPCRRKTTSCDQGNATIDCIIDCIGYVYGACVFADIYGGSGSLFINCHGEDACNSAQIHGGAGPLFINCRGYAACQGAQIHSANTPTIIDARGDDSLFAASIWCHTTEYCDITSRGNWSLNEASIYANVVNGTKLFVNATGESALQDTIIRCPID
eukprot:21776_1